MWGALLAVSVGCDLVLYVKPGRSFQTSHQSMNQALESKRVTGDRVTISCAASQENDFSRNYL